MCTQDNNKKLTDIKFEYIFERALIPAILLNEEIKSKVFVLKSLTSLKSKTKSKTKQNSCLHKK